MKIIWRTLITISLLALLGSVAEAQWIKLVEQAAAPAAQSARWHYERALIYHLREQDGRATIELYRAIEKYPNFPEAHYFLARLFEIRGHWDEAAKSLDLVLTQVNVEHTPARLLLTRARVENGQYLVAIGLLEQIAATLKLEPTFQDSLRVCRTEAFKQQNSAKDATNVNTSSAGLKDKLIKLIENAEDVLFDTPETFRSLTLAQGLKDPLVYNELLELYSEQEEDKGAFTLLEELLTVREGFAPAVLLQMGRIYEKQQSLRDAVNAYEKAVGQLTVLGFSEAAGDFSTDELQQLRVRTKAEKFSQGRANKTKANGKGANKKP
ncbi:MAG: hypothetical protein AB1489_23485 [Acidobacteriota bacterium]